MSAGTPKQGHSAVWWLCVTLSLCATKVTHWSGTVRERSRILVQFYGHAAAKPSAMQAAAHQIKGSG
ncbi:hypothetical protein O0466_003240 [Salmonella enterica]|nr:hypothetical protein [Salmonella enterica]HCM1892191.1 hypothetical protein [Salmonella enterica subsp. diarizonae serovar 57:c:e,n,x,z15]EKA4656787.1 hypothetical protein [Salmonella enterica]EKF8526227.1 hypothetical protein [Salmonella enterica]EKM8515341.1 hypothetical protein [Salmonella enterica]